MAAGNAIVLGREGATQRGAHSQHREVGSRCSVFICGFIFVICHVIGSLSLAIFKKLNC